MELEPEEKPGMAGKTGGAPGARTETPQLDVYTLGGVAFDLARRVGPEGRVLGLDMTWCTRDCCWTTWPDPPRC